MNTRRVDARKAEKGIANAGAHDSQTPSQHNQVPQLEQVPIGDQVWLVLPLLQMER